MRPQNCDALQVPKTNPEIWREMKKATRDADVQWQRLQTMVHKALTPVVVVMDLMKERREKNTPVQTWGHFLDFSYAVINHLHKTEGGNFTRASSQLPAAVCTRAPSDQSALWR